MLSRKSRSRRLKTKIKKKLLNKNYHRNNIVLSSNMMSVTGTILRIERHINYIMINGFHQSCVQHLNQKWREKRGLTENPTTFGPLTNLPDYTFKDGKPTPLGVRAKMRLEQQQEYAARIIKLVGEIDHAVEKHAKLQKENEQRRQQILDSKLKPKGHLLLKKPVNKVKK